MDVMCVFSLCLSLGVQMAVQAKESPGMSGLVSRVTEHHLSRPICITIMKSPCSIEVILREKRTIQILREKRKEPCDLGVGEKKCLPQICQHGFLPSLRSCMIPMGNRWRMKKEINGSVFAKAEQACHLLLEPSVVGEVSLSDSFKPQGL